MTHAETWQLVVALAVGIVIGWLAGLPARKAVKRRAAVGPPSLTVVGPPLPGGRFARLLDSIRLGERGPGSAP